MFRDADHAAALFVSALSTMKALGVTDAAFPRIFLGALELAKAGLSEFSAGALQQEWEGLVILALTELGEHDEAARRGDKFLSKYPDGPFSAKIRRALGK